jgi:hypothetical protein
MYYTFCEDPGCGAINDYADTRADAELNRKRHIAAHRAGGKLPLTEDGIPTRCIPTRRQVEKWAAGDVAAHPADPPVNRAG